MFAAINAGVAESRGSSRSRARRSAGRVRAPQQSRPADGGADRGHAGAGHQRHGRDDRGGGPPGRRRTTGSCAAWACSCGPRPARTRATRGCRAPMPGTAYRTFELVGDHWGMGMAAQGVGQWEGARGGGESEKWLMRSVEHLELVGAQQDVRSIRVHARRAAGARRRGGRARAAARGHALAAGEDMDVAQAHLGHRAHRLGRGRPCRGGGQRRGRHRPHRHRADPRPAGADPVPRRRRRRAPARTAPSGVDDGLPVARAVELLRLARTGARACPTCPCSARSPWGRRARGLPGRRGRGPSSCGPSACGSGPTSPCSSSSGSARGSADVLADTDRRDAELALWRTRTAAEAADAHRRAHHRPRLMLVQLADRHADDGGDAMDFLVSTMNDAPGYRVTDGARRGDRADRAGAQRRRADRCRASRRSSAGSSRG